MIRRGARYLLNRLLCRLKRDRIIRPPAGPARVNAGCALDVAPGWVNVDGSINVAFAGWPRWFLNGLYAVSGWQPFYSREHFVEVLSYNRFVHFNLEYGLPFAAGTVDCVYSSNFLTELFLEDAKVFAASCFRSLRPGGLIRITVLDWERVIEFYRQGAKLYALRLFLPASRAEMFTRRHFMYDFELLAALLREAGFCDVVRRGYREGQVPDLDLLDNRPEQTLFVEAVKPLCPASGGA